MSQPEAPAPKLIGTRRAANLLGLSVNYVTLAIDGGLIPAVRLPSRTGKHGGKRLVTTEAVLAHKATFVPYAIRLTAAEEKTLPVTPKQREAFPWIG